MYVNQIGGIINRPKEPTTTEPTTDMTDGTHPTPTPAIATGRNLSIKMKQEPTLHGGLMPTQLNVNNHPHLEAGSRGLTDEEDIAIFKEAETLTNPGKSF